MTCGEAFRSHDIGDEAREEARSAVKSLVALQSLGPQPGNVGRPFEYPAGIGRRTREEIPRGSGGKKRGLASIIEAILSSTTCMYAAAASLFHPTRSPC